MGAEIDLSPCPRGIPGQTSLHRCPEAPRSRDQQECAPRLGLGGVSWGRLGQQEGVRMQERGMGGSLVQQSLPST